VNFLRCEASLFEDRECPIFYGHGRKVDMTLFLLVRFLIRFVGRFGCDNSPIIYGGYFQVKEVDSVDIKLRIKRHSVPKSRLLHQGRGGISKDLKSDKPPHAPDQDLKSDWIFEERV